MPAISLVIIARNEAHNLPQALSNWRQFAAEAVVVDSGSTDDTQQVAAALGARVLEKPFNGYGEQKGFAVSSASHDWVFVLDADEVVTPELVAELKAFSQQPDQGLKAGYWVPRHFVFLNHLMRFGGEYGKLQLRLFDRRTGNFNLDKVHEMPVLRGETGRLKQALLHYSYQSLHQYFAKFNEYTTAAARQLADRGKLKSRAYIALRFPISFFQLYILKGLVLDGYAGFIWALFSAMYPVVKYAKAREMLQAAKAKKPQAIAPVV